jgi:hypothetical protein
MSKHNQIMEFINNNVNTSFRTTQMAETVGCSLPTILSFIKNNPSRFNKTGHGIYTILPESQEMSISTSGISEISTERQPSLLDTIVHEEMTTVETVSTNQSNYPRPTFDW